MAVNRTTRTSSLTMVEHVTEIGNALATLTVSPERVMWHYIHCAFLANGENISATARALGMHRRTLQRALNKRAPSRDGHKKEWE
jgi:two-component system response regulator RegA